MKSYSHLWEQYISQENYLLAVHNATCHKGGTKKKYRKARYFKIHAEELMPQMLEYAANFRNDSHKPMEIYDGIRRKKRKIIVPSMREQVVHHMLINVLKPIFMKPMYRHSYGSIPGRGASAKRYTGHRKGKKKKNTLGGKEAIEKFIRDHPEDCRYCLKMDIRKFFDSVPHRILKEKFHKLIHDERFLQVIETVIEANGSDVGMPIGFYTSQWFANFYLTGLDHYIKEQLRAKAYFRFMDDMVIFGSNKRDLHRIRKEVEIYLREHLGLELNPNWQVFRFHYVKRNGKEIGRFLDFMGFRFYRNRTTLRQTLMLRATRKARKISRKKPKTSYDCRQMLSYKGWISPANVYGMYRKWIKPFISFRQLRRIVSKAQKKENQERSKEHVEQERKQRRDSAGSPGQKVQPGIRLCAQGLCAG